VMMSEIASLITHNTENRGPYYLHIENITLKIQPTKQIMFICNMLQNTELPEEEREHVARNILRWAKKLYPYQKDLRIVMEATAESIYPSSK